MYSNKVISILLEISLLCPSFSFAEGENIKNQPWIFLAVTIAKNLLWLREGAGVRQTTTNRRLGVHASARMASES